MNHVTFVTLNNYNMATDKANLFSGQIDRFQGVTVRSDKEECPDSEFEKKLEGNNVYIIDLLKELNFVESLNHWRATGNRGIWFNVHLKQASWVPILAQVSSYL